MARWEEGEVDPASYDTGEWVDVGRDGLWRPSAVERLRALLVIGVAIGLLAVLAAVVSVGGDEDDDDLVAATTTTTEPEVVTTTSIVPTTTLDPASIDGEPPPEVCEPDIGREAAPLRGRSEVGVLVLNGTSRTGHAGAITDDLDDLGYETNVPANASRHAVTTVEYLPGFCVEATRVAFELGIEGVEVAPLLDSDVFLGRAQLLVTLGADSL